MAGGRDQPTRRSPHSPACRREQARVDCSGGRPRGVHLMPIRHGTRRSFSAARSVRAEGRGRNGAAVHPGRDRATWTSASSGERAGLAQTRRALFGHRTGSRMRDHRLWMRGAGCCGIRRNHGLASSPTRTVISPSDPGSRIDYHAPPRSVEDPAAGRAGPCVPAASLRTPAVRTIAVVRARFPATPPASHRGGEPWNAREATAWLEHGGDPGEVKATSRNQRGHRADGGAVARPDHPGAEPGLAGAPRHEVTLPGTGGVAMSPPIEDPGDLQE